MTAVDVAMNVVHLIAAGLWVGGLALMAGAVVPLAREGRLGADAVRGLGRRAAIWGRVLAVVVLLTGGHLAANLYGGGALTGTENGRLVLAMATLWLVLIALTEAGAARLRKDPEGGLDRATWLFRAAAGVGVVLLAIGGLL